jgi:hypothetical protein
MITDIKAIYDRSWCKDREKVSAFLAHEFCSSRTKPDFKTAKFWSSLIAYMAQAEPSASLREIALAFGHDRNAAKRAIHQINVRANAFFEDDKTAWGSGSRRPEGGNNDSDTKRTGQTIPYEPARLSARLPSPVLIGNRFEYPDFDDEFWENRNSAELGFMEAFEQELKLLSARQSRLAEKAGRRYAELCKGKHSAKDLEGRALFIDFPATQALPTEERQCTEIKVQGKGLSWTISHSQYGSGEILDVLNQVVLCRFPQGRINLYADAIKRKTGKDLQKIFTLQKAIERVAARHSLVETQDLNSNQFFNIQETEQGTTSANA